MVTMIDKARRARATTGTLHLAHDERRRESAELREAFERGLRRGHEAGWNWGLACGVTMTLCVGAVVTIVFEHLAPYL